MVAFLDALKPGMGDKYGASFAEVGLETQADIGLLGTPEYEEILESLLKNLSNKKASPMDLRMISIRFSPCASAAAPRGDRAGGGTGSVAVHNAGDAGGAAGAAAPIETAAAGAAAAAPSAPDASSGGGGDDAPERGAVYTILEEISVGFSELFEWQLRRVGVQNAATLDLLAQQEEQFVALQVEQFDAPPLQKQILLRALQMRGRKQRPRDPQPRGTWSEPELDARSDEEACRRGDRKDERKARRTFAPFGSSRPRGAAHPRVLPRVLPRVH